MVSEHFSPLVMRDFFIIAKIHIQFHASAPFCFSPNPKRTFSFFFFLKDLRHRTLGHQILYGLIHFNYKLSLPWENKSLSAQNFYQYITLIRVILTSQCKHKGIFIPVTVQSGLTSFHLTEEPPPQHQKSDYKWILTLVYTVSF